MDLIIKKCKAATPDGIQNLNIGVRNGVISKLSKTSFKADESINAKGKLVLPGLIDAHVHFRDPGLTHKEDWYTGSCSAACGGVTTVIDMPNTIPPTTSKERVKEKERIAKKKSVVDYIVAGGVNSTNYNKLKTLDVKALKVYMAETYGGLRLSSNLLPRVFENAARTKKLLMVHAEDQKRINEHTKKISGEKDPEKYADSRPNIVEEKAVERVVKLANKYNTRMHLVHISTKEALLFLRTTKTKNISFEVTAHHLFLNKSALRELGSCAKINPPLRSVVDQYHLWEAVKYGFVDCITSDHSPHTLEEKVDNIWEAPAGFPGVETTLPLLLTQLPKKRLSLSTLVKLTSSNPASIHRLKNKGGIRVGKHADLVIVDLLKEKKIRGSELHSKCGWTPYEAWECRGWPIMTLVRGKLVQEHGEIMVKKGWGRKA